MINFLSNLNIPTSDQPGSFAFRRKNHIHEGVDLYCNSNDRVYAFASGIVNAIYPFTGEQVQMPWWNNTDAISIADCNGSWVYGEIVVNCELKVGDSVNKGDYLGYVTPVLKVNKNRPMSMVHIERWKPGYIPYTFLWQLDQSQPEFLLDPTQLLKELKHEHDVIAKGCNCNFETTSL